ncbi:MAG: hypothetical protein ACOX60_01465 [Massiliimalia sp.]|jgi:hypothetical protein
MKNFFSRIRFPMVLSLLLLAALVTFPSAITESKYVWQEDIHITLKVDCPEQKEEADLFSADNWTLQLTNIQAIPQKDGLVLSAVEGYILPESITVMLRENTYSVFTNGLNNPEGISFDPQTGLLSIADTLLAESQGTVTVIASGQLNPDHMNGKEPVEETTPEEENAPIEETTPDEKTPPEEEITSTQNDNMVSSPTTTDTEKLTETE